MSKFNKQSWRLNLKRIGLFLVIIKCWILLQNVINQSPNISNVQVTNKLENIYDINTERFRILDLENVSFTLKPQGSCEKVNIVLLILSAPKNVKKREKLRAQFRKVKSFALLHYRSFQDDKKYKSQIHIKTLSEFTDC